MTKSRIDFIKTYGTVLLGGAVFALGFNWFLLPNSISAGGLSGLSLVLTHLLGFGSVGIFTALLNIPVFLTGWKKLGRSFLIRSMTGMLSSSLLLEVFAFLPAPDTDPLLGALAGGVCCGVGIGLVFSRGATTGGADMIARLLKQEFTGIPMGRLIFLVDMVVVALTGIVFRDLNKALYSVVTLYVSSLLVDRLLYGPDVAAVAMIFSFHYEQIAKAIGDELHRGVTVISARGWHSGEARPVLLSAVRKNQIASLRVLIHAADPEAFVILQEAHQILGRGFRRYSGEEL